MNVVPDRELHDFINSLGVKDVLAESENRATEAAATAAAVETSGIWQSIADALDHWS